jgi:hypothetical protein
MRQAGPSFVSPNLVRADWIPGGVSRNLVRDLGMTKLLGPSKGSAGGRGNVGPGGDVVRGPGEGGRWVVRDAILLRVRQARFWYFRAGGLLMCSS